MKMVINAQLETHMSFNLIITIINNLANKKMIKILFIITKKEPIDSMVDNLERKNWSRKKNRCQRALKRKRIYLMFDVTDDDAPLTVGMDIKNIL